MDLDHYSLRALEMALMTETDPDRLAAIQARIDELTKPVDPD